LIFHPQAETFSHLFFSQGLTQNFRGWLASHPPLQDRIRRLEPDWDGMYYANLQPLPDEPPPPFPANYAAAVQLNANGNADLATLLLANSSLAMAQIAPTPTIGAANTVEPLPVQPLPVQPLPVQPLTVQPLIVQPLTVPNSNDSASPVLYDITAPNEWLPLLPPALVQAARSPFDARQLFYRLLLADDQATQLKQRQLLEQEEAAVLALAQYSIPCGLRLGLVELAIPTLKELTAEQYQAFHNKLWQLIQADQQTSFSEWVLYRMLTHQLTPHFSQNARQQVLYREISDVTGEIAQWLSYLAHQAKEDATAALIFAAGSQPLAPLPLILQPLPTQESLSQALDKLQQSSSTIRFNCLQAIIKAIEYDGKISAHEAELFQMLSYCLDCPLPPPQV
jgi:hypothetical protein